MTEKSLVEQLKESIINNDKAKRKYENLAGLGDGYMTSKGQITKEKIDSALARSNLTEYNLRWSYFL